MLLFMAGLRTLNASIRQKNKLTDKKELLLKAFENVINPPKMTVMDSEIIR
jgi:hypothetical protein